jgi:phenylalanine-4-hydroxylase
MGAKMATAADLSRLRGDYSHIATDYTVAQDWRAYSAADHALWRTLYRRQSALLPRYACPEVIAATARLDAGSAIPNLARASEMLFRATKWQLVAVPGLIPDDVFFDHLAHRRFPVTVWIRRLDEIDYLVEPDIFHDFFGHVPMLLDPMFADYLAAYGRKGVEASALDATKFLARLYWYMVEFGLIATSAGPRVYGAGILSSKGETVYAVEDQRPHRIAFDLERVMRTDYRIDAFQETYFVIDSFAQLFEATLRDFTPLYRKLAEAPAIAPSTLVPGDRVVDLPRHAA